VSHTVDNNMNRDARQETAERRNNFAPVVTYPMAPSKLQAGGSPPAASPPLSPAPPGRCQSHQSSKPRPPSGDVDVAKEKRSISLPDIAGTQQPMGSLASKDSISSAVSHGTHTSSSAYTEADDESSSEEEIAIPPLSIVKQGAIREGGVWCGVLTQAGFYPNKDDHKNQDRTMAALPKRSQMYDTVLGVMDGHGPEGHLVAAFVQDSLQKVAEPHLNRESSPFDALRKTHVELQHLLERSPIDVRLSGTTCVTAWLQGEQVLLANVGDSRAVMGRRTNNSSTLRAIDLTQDQTPFRPDERRRVQAAGANVVTSGEIHGEATYSSPAEYTADDPPRCYLPGFQLPGTAFTRSLGDTIAQTIGVVPTPEVSVVKITPADAFLILASDGVWEFLTSQEAVDIVARHSSPEHGAAELIKAAWDLWHTEDIRADDISVVVAFLDHAGIVRHSAQSFPNK